MEKGFSVSKKKDGTFSYRASVTYKDKHISIGSFSDEASAHTAYLEAWKILNADKRTINIENFKEQLNVLSKDKAVSLLNFRDRKIYIKTPIYLRDGYFSYFLFSKEKPALAKKSFQKKTESKNNSVRKTLIVRELKFSNDDLFYYSQHRILLHDGHLYVNDYGMQYGILARYGIKNFAVEGRDYSFSNGDRDDFRYENIIIYSSYHGVICLHENGAVRFQTKIKINGEFNIGIFHSEIKAAIAYNKAADFAKSHGSLKNFPQNYIDSISAREYAEIYTGIKLPEKYMKYLT